MNVIAQYQLWKTSSNAAGCTSRYQRHGVVELPGERFHLFHTTAQHEDIIPYLNQTADCGEDNAPISNQRDSLGMAPAEEQPEQVNRESTGSVSDLLPDLTSELRRKSPYVVASGGFGDSVAAKTIRVSESDGDAKMSRKGKKLHRELKVRSCLRHECPLLGVAYNFGFHFAMIYPWVDGGALTGFLTRQQDTLSCQDKFSLLNDIVLGLQYHSEETSGPTTVAEELLHVQDSRDSIDRELDATEQLPPPEASMPAVAAAPPAQHRKKATTSAYIQVFPR
ncbi:hypothetical protein M405DRAFT_867049 [Rhizopogon salebrosus TDB-379]|nr:hypothetical protein M405DRAFT_867049 [Rhizopogon salebrosus TDB-379]